ncbi:HNH endonuclease [Mycolicibacterium sp.]|uniref:HNH endonuclease n=1 Tax=Mycolicibacterium sp. TaxID=2320850 RepID=UPI0037C90D4B
MTGRTNDARAKRLRARLRAQGLPCYLCGSDIDYDAHHHDPLSFQVDHKWQVANGGPEFDADNIAPSHRACNRTRSDTIDQIAIGAAASYGHTLTPRTATGKRGCATEGPCANCNGAQHNPQPGVTFITHRNWWDKPPNPDMPAAAMAQFGPNS